MDFSVCNSRVLPPPTRLSQGMMGGCGLGVVCGHIKALASFFSHVKEVSVLKACRAVMP